MFIIGIDPGMTGAVVAIDDNGKYISHFSIKSMKNQLKNPVNIIDCEKFNDSWLVLLYKIITPMLPNVQIIKKDISIIIENPNIYRDKDGGIYTTANQFTTLGAILGIIAASIRTFDDCANFNIQQITSKEWKNYFKLKGGKENKYKSIELAALYDDFFVGMKKKDHDIAEAFLIAKYGKLFFK